MKKKRYITTFSTTDGDLIEALKARAVRDDISVTAVVRHALRQLLNVRSGPREFKRRKA
jgi:hypothetical protein